jgi:hypothetical protein
VEILLIIRRSAYTACWKCNYKYTHDIFRISNNRLEIIQKLVLKFLTSTIVNGFIRDAELKIFREADADYAREYATSSFTANQSIPTFTEH